jgi:hypothetical protein
MSWLSSSVEVDGVFRGFWRRPSTITLIFVALTILAIGMLLLLPE